MPGFELIGKEERDAVNEIFSKGAPLSRLGPGAGKVSEFEAELAKELGAKYAYAVTSGTTALLTALRGLDIRPGDEVITQCFTFVATAEAIIQVGAVPVMTEINKTLNMDPGDLKAKITKKTRAIVPVHMMGAPAQMDELTAIARERNLAIMEDSCQALGATYKGKKVGTIGDIGCYSFDYGKTLTTGEGGMIVSNNKEVFDRAKEFADHGHQNNPDLSRARDSRRISGLNFRMTELQASVGLAQLRKLNSGIARQRENKKKLLDGIKGVKGIELVELADAEGELGDSLVFLLGDTDRAERFDKQLAENGLGTKNIPSAMDWHFAGTWSHMLPKLDKYKGKDLGKLWGKSGSILRRTIALPVMIKMDDAQIGKVVNVIRKIAREVS